MLVEQPSDDSHALRLPLDVRGEHQVAALRVAASLLAVVGGIWLLALPYRVPRVVALLGLGFGILFMRRALRARTLDAASHYLELGRDALRIQNGEQLQIVPWDEVQAVRVDEDRLLVAVERRAASPLEIEPRYRGLALYELGSALHEALEAARKRGGCAPASDG